MTAFQIAYTALGGLGIFFYGMKLMSEGLQAAAGKMIRDIINSITTNRFLAVIVGMLVTMLVQSSSVTTVMTVGFVNAGLMKLTQAIGVIFGANIGTTITGWIISVKIGKYGLLLVGLAIFPSLFAKSSKIKNTGLIILGMGLIFLGLETMSDAFKPLRTNPDFISSISYFAGSGVLNHLACTLMACLLTMLIQSSSAMLGITMALAATGVIEFHTAVALVLGENIGTTITALLAAIGGNVNARRAARAHAIFNVLGVTVMFAFLPYYVQLIEYIVPGGANDTDGQGNFPNIASHIALAHTMFNVCSVLLFLPFINKLARFVIRITPDKSNHDQEHHLELLGNVSDLLPATALSQAAQAVRKFKGIVDRHVQMTKEYLFEEQTSPRLYERIEKYETITDNMEKEVTIFVCKIMEKSLTNEQSLEAHGIIRIADELESISDYLVRLASYKEKYEESGKLFEGETLAVIKDFFEKVETYYKFTTDKLFDRTQNHFEEAWKRSEVLRLEAHNIRNAHIKRVSQGSYDALSAMSFSDIIVALRKIRSHSLNIAQAFKKEQKENVKL